MPGGCDMVLETVSEFSGRSRLWRGFDAMTLPTRREWLTLERYHVFRADPSAQGCDEDRRLASFAILEEDAQARSQDE